MKQKILSIVLAAVLSGALLAGCGSSTGSTASTEASSAAVSEEEAAEDVSEASEPEAEEEEDAAQEESTAAETASEENTQEKVPETQAESNAAVTTDRAGNEITVPAEVDSIISMAPSTTRVLIDLGVADRIIAIDTNSAVYADELPEGIPQFDMMAPDNEAIAALEPDIVFTSGMSSSGGTDVFKSLKDAGICVADIPSSTSFAGIDEDIQFIGDCVGESAGAQAIVEAFDETISGIAAAAADVTAQEQKTVLLMISIPTTDYPTVYSAGAGTYLDEIITTVGAVNAVGDQEGWPAISEEDAAALNPDVIITNVNYVEDPVGTIESLPGWENVTAVVNGDVYYVAADASSQPNQHVADAAVSMAKDIYPEVFEDWEDPLADANAAVAGSSAADDAA